MTPIAAVLAGRNAFISGFRERLNNLIRTRIQAQDKSPVTPQEAQAIADAVKPQIEAAIKSRLSFWQKTAPTSVAQFSAAVDIATVIDDGPARAEALQVCAYVADDVVSLVTS